jgi:hypothetical protein
MEQSHTGAATFGAAKRGVCFLLFGCAFALAYAQAPLYYSNQNQYFLHGLANAGHGVLRDDWLANTTDPTPVFSFLVALTARFLSEYCFHVYYAILLGIYAISMLSIFTHLAGERCTPQLQLAFAALLMLVHSAFLRWASYRLLGLDYACYFQGWLAAQYVLGPVLQPSAFGVLLVLAIALFVQDRPYGAATSAALGATLHSTYLLAAALLTLAFMILIWRDGQRRKAIFLGLWSLLLVAPTVIYALIAFRPTSADAFAEAQGILVHVRIPHHCVPRLWCDGITWMQLGWMVLALYLLRGTRLFFLFSFVFAASVGLTLLQVATDHDTLALLFPWRTSVILIPLATTVILARVVLLGAAWLDQRPVGIGCILLTAGLAAAGIAIMQYRQGFPMNDDETPLLEYVRTNKAEGDIYLLPMQVPNLSATVRGSLSSDFKPARAKQADQRLIPFDFQRFRLHTGAPIFVDFKAIPYKDTDVLEWHRRIVWNHQMYQERDWNRPETLRDLKHNGITHVIATRDRDIQCGECERVYEDANYRVYRFR